MKSLYLILTIISVTFFSLTSIGQNCTNCSGGTVSGTNASGLGTTPTATGNSSLAGGHTTIASGDYSFAFGSMSKATGVSSFAFGAMVEANNSNSLVIGRHLKTTASATFILGTGAGPNANQLLVNSVPSSLMVGFNSAYPTFFVGTSAFGDKTGKVAIGNMTNPTAKFHIYSDENEAAEIKLEPRTTGIRQYAQILFDTHSIRAGKTENMVFTTPAGRNFAFTNGNVGINTTAPTQKLDIDGNIRLRNNATIGTWSSNSLTFNTNSTAKMVILADGRVGIGNSDPTQKLDIDGNIRLRNNAIIGTWSDNSLTFNTNSAARMTVDANGNVGIGGGDPVAKLQITDGDIFIEDIDRGIIMKSPDGNCWRGTLNNQGLLEFTPLPDCLTTAVSENKPEDKPLFRISPNPASGTLQISCTPEELKEFSEYSLFDSAGNQLKTGKLNKTTFTLNIQELAAGTYILNFSGTRKFWSEKVIVR